MSQRTCQRYMTSKNQAVADRTLTRRRIFRGQAAFSKIVASEKTIDIFRPSRRFRSFVVNERARELFGGGKDGFRDFSVLRRLCRRDVVCRRRIDRNSGGGRGPQMRGQSFDRDVAAE